MATTTIHTLAYQVVANTKGFKQGMTATRQEMSEAKKMMEASKAPLDRLTEGQRNLSSMYRKGLIDLGTYRRELEKLNTDFKKSTESAGGLGSKISSLFGGVSFGRLAAAGGAGLGAALFRGLDLAGTEEQAKVAFKVILGSKEVAEQLISDIQQFAAATPFESSELIATAKSLAAFQFTAEELLPTMRRLGDVASGLDIPLGELAFVFGTMRTQGRAFAADIRQFTGRGIPIIEELAKQFGVTSEEVNKMVSDGKVGFKEIEKAFISMTGEGGKFFDMMKQQSSTLKGQVSTLRDDFDQMLKAFGQMNIGAVKAGLPAPSTSLKGMAIFFRMTGAMLQGEEALKTEAAKIKAEISPPLARAFTREELFENEKKRLEQEAKEQKERQEQNRQAFGGLKNAVAGTLPSNPFAFGVTAARHFADVRLGALGGMFGGLADETVALQQAMEKQKETTQAARPGGAGLAMGSAEAFSAIQAARVRMADSPEQQQVTILRSIADLLRKGQITVENVAF